MAEEHTSGSQFDMFVVFDESKQSEVDKVILTPLKNRGVTCCDLESDILSGHPIIESISKLIQRSNKTLIVEPISDELHQQLSLVGLSELCHYVSLEKTYESQKSDSKDISNAPDWVLKDNPIPDMRENSCHVVISMAPRSQCLQDVLFHAGFPNINSTNLNISGIKIVPSKFKVILDLSDYKENIESHQNNKTDKMMELLPHMRSLRTKVELRIDTDDKDSMDIVNQEFFPSICSSVLDIEDLEQNKCIVAYTIDGPMVVERKVMSEIYYAVRRLIVGRILPDTVQYPEYDNEEKRKNTFNGTVFHNKKTLMAEAGFFFAGLRDRVRCYHCGGGIVAWEESEDPWTVHAMGFPTCALVKKKMPEDVIEKLAKEGRRNKKSLVNNADYESTEKRHESLREMEVESTSKMDVDGNHKLKSNLAEAGFYYIGPKDRVCCFSCGITMLEIPRNVSLEKLLSKHACVSPNCVYIKSKFPPDKLRFLLSIQSLDSKWLSVKFFIRTFGRCQSPWPPYMLSS